MYRLLTALFLVLLSGSPVSANVVIGGAAFLAYPTITFLNVSVLALGLVVLVEWLIYFRISSVGFLKSFLVIVTANLFSSFIGMVVAIFCSSGGLFIIMLLPLTFFLGKIGQSTFRKSVILEKFAGSTTIGSLLLMLFILLPGVYLLPLTNRHLTGHGYDPYSALVLLAVFSIILVGFIFTLMTEAFVANFFIKNSGQECHKNSFKAVFVMNLISYVLLVGIYGQPVLEKIFNLR